MNEAEKDRVTRGLLHAIRTEQDGYHFYQMAARSTDDPQGREVFERLAQEELEHHRFLRRQYRSLLDSGRPDSAATLGAPMDLSGENPIFSPALRDRVGEAHFEMSALSIGVQLELSSIQHYRQEAAAAADSEVARFYQELVDWESGHYHALLAQQDALRDDYWKAGGFEPF